MEKAKALYFIDERGVHVVLPTREVSWIKGYDNSDIAQEGIPLNYWIVIKSKDGELFVINYENNKKERDMYLEKLRHWYFILPLRDE